jgi:hypothetical protein
MCCNGVSLNHADGIIAFGSTQINPKYCLLEQSSIFKMSAYCS